MRRAGLSAVTLLIGCALAACAPRLAPPVPQPDPYGAALSITAKADYQVVRVVSGSLSAGLTVNLYAQPGRAVAVNSGLCVMKGSDVTCSFPTLSAGGAYNIPARNVGRASAEVVRPNGLTYTVNSP